MPTSNPIEPQIPYSGRVVSTLGFIKAHLARILARGEELGEKLGRSMESK